MSREFYPILALIASDFLESIHLDSVKDFVLLISISTKKNQTQMFIVYIEIDIRFQLYIDE